MDKREMERFIYRAYIRDGEQFHTGEAMLLACLMHAKGRGRDSADMKDVRRIMRDHNLDQGKQTTKKGD